MLSVVLTETNMVARLGDDCSCLFGRIAWSVMLSIVCKALIVPEPLCLLESVLAAGVLDGG